MKTATLPCSPHARPSSSQPGKQRAPATPVVSRRRWFWLRNGIAHLAVGLIFAGAASASAQTDAITELSMPAPDASFAKGINANGLISGCSTTGATAGMS